MNTEPNEPINGDAHCPNPKFNYFSYGLTKREYFAVMALQSVHINSSTNISFEDIASESVKLADALIKALNQTK